MSPPDALALVYRHEDGAPAFSEQWHAQVIAVVEVLIADEKIDAATWADALGATRAAQASAGEPDTEEVYYSAVLSTLEGLLAGSAAPRDEVDKTEGDWRRAYLSTPHGQPVVLRREEP